MGSFFNLRIDGSRRCQMRVPLERGVGDIYCCPRKFKNLMFWNIISNVLMMFIFMFATLHTGPQFYFIFCTFFLSVSQRSRVWIPNKSESGFLFATAKVVYITTTIILHLILHPAVNVYDFHIFKTYVYSVRCHENLFEKYIQKEVKIGIFPTPIAYWSGFGISCNIGRIPIRLGWLDSLLYARRRQKN